MRRRRKESQRERGRQSCKQRNQSSTLILFHLSPLCYNAPCTMMTRRYFPTIVTLWLGNSDITMTQSQTNQQTYLHIYK